MAFRQDQFDLDEVYRQLRTNIEFSAMDNQIQVVNTISTSPNEGKSTVATNLARISADKYNRVLILDCDLRNPTVHRMFGISNSEGLSNLLARFDQNVSLMAAPELKAVQTETGKIFYFLPAGSRVPNPQELLSSNRFAALLQIARKEFDFIVIDCPPIGACSDGIPVCNAADGTLFVVSSKDTDKRAARNASKDLIRAGANIIGVCLSKVEDFHSNHYYYYGYGENGKKKKVKKMKKVKKA